MGLLSNGITLPEAYPEIERQFKILWADHGDAISQQYAGEAVKQRLCLCLLTARVPPPSVSLSSGSTLICISPVGTGALKSGFTRTGKRTVGGILDDGYKSVARYYLNNFQDGKKQDAVDLVTGEGSHSEG